MDLPRLVGCDGDAGAILDGIERFAVASMLGAPRDDFALIVLLRASSVTADD